MNEIERAVAEIIGTNYGENQCHRETMVLAAEALREKADREKSEQWCKKETNGGLLAICPKCNYPVSWWYKTPFCANCGKRLEVEHE